MEYGEKNRSCCDDRYSVVPWPAASSDNHEPKQYPRVAEAFSIPPRNVGSPAYTRRDRGERIPRGLGGNAKSARALYWRSHFNIRDSPLARDQSARKFDDRVESYEPSRQGRQRPDRSIQTKSRGVVSKRGGLRRQARPLGFDRRGPALRLDWRLRLSGPIVTLQFQPIGAPEKDRKS